MHKVRRPPSGRILLFFQLVSVELEPLPAITGTRPATLVDGETADPSSLLSGSWWKIPL